MAVQSLDDSKHNPDFISRTLAKRLEIETLLAAFHIQLKLIVDQRDQTALDDLHARVVKKAGIGFDESRLLVRRPSHAGDCMWWDEAGKEEMMRKAMEAGGDVSEETCARRDSVSEFTMPQEGCEDQTECEEAGVSERTAASREGRPLKKLATATNNVQQRSILRNYRVD